MKIMTKLGLLALLTLGAALGACSAETQDSGTSDIFREDQGDPSSGNERRHPADDEEKLWTVNMGGCTGHLLSPEYMMTASHCSPYAGARYTSGAAIVRRQRADIVVSQVVELDPNLDYAIVKIQWNGGYPREQKFPPLVATKPSDVAASAQGSSGDELFTVGFPSDKAGTWGATYSQGYAKQISEPSLLYNVGIINGNSGGGVWRKRDKMLVSLTNGGAHMIGQSGWDQGSLESWQSWNHGVAMWNVYARSAVLRDIFPGGKNRFTTDDAKSDDAYAAIGLADNAAADAFTLALSAPKTAARLVLCATARPADCKPGAEAYVEARFDRAAGEVLIFKTPTAIALADGKTWSLVASDTQGRSVATRSFRFQPN